MSFAQVFKLLLCTFGVSLGQIFFKLGAQKLTGLSASDFLSKVFLNPFVLVALVLYASATILWIWILREVPLALAYPFMAAAFVLVPLISWFFLGESLSLSTIVGLIFVVCGLLIISIL